MIDLCIQRILLYTALFNYSTTAKLHVFNSTNSAAAVLQPPMLIPSFVLCSNRCLHAFDGAVVNVLLPRHLGVRKHKVCNLLDFASLERRAVRTLGAKLAVNVAVHHVLGVTLAEVLKDVNFDAARF